MGYIGGALLTVQQQFYSLQQSPLLTSVIRPRQWFAPRSNFHQGRGSDAGKVIKQKIKNANSNHIHELKTNN